VVSNAIEGTTPVEPEKTPEEGYHLMEDMTDKASAWISQQKALAPDKPFFVYFAPAPRNAPHHVPKEWADKYKGKFDAGWDKLREEILAAEEAWVVQRTASSPNAMRRSRRGTTCRRRSSRCCPGDGSLRGFMEYTDHHVGRLFDGLKKLGILENTLIYYIIGDNGASAEGSLNGASTR